MQSPWRDAGVTLIDCEHKTPPAVSIGHPYVAIPQLKQGRIDLSEARRISKDHFLQWTRKASPQAYDVILSRRCNPGETAFVPPKMECALGQNLVLLRADGSKVYPPFLRWLVRGPEWWEQIGKFLNAGAVFESLKCADIPNFCLTIPTIKDQRRIAEILGSLDDKIELNRRMNETLEGMARALFKSWFVDFDPVRAKAAGRKPAGLSKELAALFPKSFEDSEVGEIPSGWQARLLPEVFEINPTRSLAKGKLAPYLDMSNMPTQGPSPDSWVMREMGSGMKFINGDTLVARITPCLENGKTAYVDFLANGEVAWGSTEYIVLRPKGAIPPIFAYLLARTDDFRIFAIQQMTGSSGRQRVPADSLGKYRLTTPDLNSPLFQHFGNLVTRMFERIKVDAEECRTLATLRDSLLPKLISGELRVPEAERIVGRAI